MNGWLFAISAVSTSASVRSCATIVISKEPFPILFPHNELNIDSNGYLFRQMA
jgi:hypothetical protein